MDTEGKDEIVVNTENFDKEVCVKCQSSSLVNLQETKKGLQTIINYAEKSGKNTLLQFLKKQQESNSSVKIHAQCQKDIYNELKRKGPIVPQQQTKLPRIETRKQKDQFAWKDNCFFCDKKCQVDKKNPKRSNISIVTTLPFRDKLLLICAQHNNEWSRTVERRVLGCHDLIAADGRYHSSCYREFVKQKQSSFCSPGRPTEKNSLKIFYSVCEWIESECELYSLKEIHSKMVDLAENENEVYSIKWLKVKLKEHYKESIFFSEMNGKSDVVCFRNLANFLISDSWFAKRKENINEEANRIILMASKLIASDIRSATYNCDKYPSNDQIEQKQYGLNWLPPYLRLFMQHLIKNTLKQISIGQAIVTAARPNSCISPLLFGIGVELDHVFGSRWLVTELNRLGFSVSAEEVNRFKQSVVEHENISTFLKENMHGHFSQWSADNIDHNVRTLDGHGTFHAMGIVCSTTSVDNNDTTEPSNSYQFVRQKRKIVKDIIKEKGIEIIPYNSDKNGMSDIVFKDLVELLQPVVIPPDTNVDFYWHTLSLIKGDKRPNWSGYMSNVSDGKYPGKSIVNILPIIDLDPTDMSCIYSTIKFVENEASNLGIETPILTFDQPLWLKAQEIIHSKEISVVLILGGFHLLMSFCGSVGYVMKGSGLQEAWNTIYGANTVEYMLSGKAISRALRAHFLAESALTSSLLKQCVEKPIGNEEDQLDLDELKKEVDSIENCHNNLAVVTTDSKILKKWEEKLKKAKNNLIDISRTSKLWIQYLDYVDIIKKFIRADRTGNWNLHLTTVSGMINLLAATGHIHYARCARLYLQNMLELPTSYPWVYKSFMQNGYSTVRRSDKYWAGIWTDLVIEQVLMRSLKSRGGLTRGRGVTESVRTLWTNSMHRCAGVHIAMTALTGHSHKTSEQHVELSSSRIQRDNEDLAKLTIWFTDHNPFDPVEYSLKSLSSGLTAREHDNINCDSAEDVGRQNQKKLNQVSFKNAKIKKADRVHTLIELQPGVKLDQQNVYVDPTILFTRLTAIIGTTEPDIHEYFQYELTPEPTSLFKDNMMRKPVKSVLRNKLLNMTEGFSVINANVCVIDGGALLHKVVWPNKCKFKDILDVYCHYVTKRYSGYEKVEIVFDGYSSSDSTKSHEQIRRGCSTSANITISKEISVSTTREMFLRNSKNKQNFIKLLSEELELIGCKIQQAISDADTMIVKTALELCSDYNVVVYADDTDILILLCYHWNQHLKPLYFSTEMKGELKIWDVGNIVNGLEVQKYLLFAHAWSGSDTTSAIYQQGKLKILNHLNKPEFQENADYFGNIESTHKQIAEAGKNLILLSYGAKQTDSINRLRYTSYVTMVSTASTVNPEKLPPTEDAICFHAFRVHLQACQWRYLNMEILDAVKWGWTKTDTIMVPKKTDLSPAPDWLLNVVRCKCKNGTKNQCGTMLCSCRKNGLQCVVACGDCHGEACKNASYENEEFGDVNAEVEDEFDKNIFDLFN